MNNELLLLIKKHTDTLIEQTKSRPQETLEFKINKQTETFSFTPPINLPERGKRLLGVISFECTNSVFNITNDNNSFSISVPGHWNCEGNEEIINKLNNLLELNFENGIELHVEEVRRRRNQTKIGDNEYLELSDLDNRKYSNIKELKRVQYRDLEELVFRLQLTYHEIVDILDVKYIAGSTEGYTLAPVFYEIIDINFYVEVFTS